MSDSLQSHGLYRVWNLEFSRPEYWHGQPFPYPKDLPNPGIKHRSHTLQEDSLPAGPQGEPKNTIVGSLPLLQGVFLTRDSNRSFGHCRQFVYQLSYQGALCLFIQIYFQLFYSFHCNGEQDYSLISLSEYLLLVYRNIRVSVY